jgi:hypothetical protein
VMMMLLMTIMIFNRLKIQKLTSPKFWQHSIHNVIIYLPWRHFWKHAVQREGEVGTTAWKASCYISYTILNVLYLHDEVCRQLPIAYAWVRPPPKPMRFVVDTGATGQKCIRSYLFFSRLLLWQNSKIVSLHLTQTLRSLQQWHSTCVPRHIRVLRAFVKCLDLT